MVRWADGSHAVVHPALIAPAGVDPYAGLSETDRQRWQLLDCYEAGNGTVAYLPATLVIPGDILQIERGGQSRFMDLREVIATAPHDQPGILAVTIRTGVTKTGTVTYPEASRAGVMIPADHPTLAATLSAARARLAQRAAADEQADAPLAPAGAASLQFHRHGDSYYAETTYGPNLVRDRTYWIRPAAAGSGWVVSWTNELTRPDDHDGLDPLERPRRRGTLTDAKRTASAWHDHRTGVLAQRDAATSPARSPATGPDAPRPQQDMPAPSGSPAGADATAPGPGQVEADTLIDAALGLAARRNQARVPPDYAALSTMIKRQRTALTRAVHSGDPGRVIIAVHRAVLEWDQPGTVWPDDWAHWQRTLDDTLGWGHHIELDDLRWASETDDPDAVLAATRAAAAARARRQQPVDYDAVNLMVQQQQETLADALASGAPWQVVLAVRDAVLGWNQPGAAWPDTWRQWQTALDDTLPPHRQVELHDLADAAAVIAHQAAAAAPQPGTRPAPDGDAAPADDHPDEPGQPRSAPTADSHLATSPAPHAAAPGPGSSQEPAPAHAGAGRDRAGDDSLVPASAPGESAPAGQHDTPAPARAAAAAPGPAGPGNRTGGSRSLPGRPPPTGFRATTTSRPTATTTHCRRAWSRRAITSARTRPRQSRSPGPTTPARSAAVGSRPLSPGGSPRRSARPEPPPRPPNCTRRPPATRAPTGSAWPTPPPRTSDLPAGTHGRSRRPGRHSARRSAPQSPSSA